MNSPAMGIKSILESCINKIANYNLSIQGIRVRDSSGTPQER